MIIVYGADFLVKKTLLNYFKERAVGVGNLEELSQVLKDVDHDFHFINANIKSYGIGVLKTTPADRINEVIEEDFKLLPLLSAHRPLSFINLIPNCVYPERISVPFREEDLYNGRPEETVSYYSLARKLLIDQSIAYEKQYGMRVKNLIVTASFGPYDDFSEVAQVVPAMMKKFKTAIDQKQKNISMWGGGRAKRDFIFSLDMPKIIDKFIHMDISSDPINVTGEREICIKDLAESIKEICHYEGTLDWDSTKPEGILRKCLSSEKFFTHLPDFEFTPMKESLQLTWNWFVENKSLDLSER